MYLNTTPGDEVHLMRTMIRKAFWDVLYNEEALKKAHKRLACAKALVARVSYPFSLDEAADAYDDREDDPETPEEWVKSVVGSAVWSVKHHEDDLTAAHSTLAVVKAMLMRGKFVEIDLAEVAKDIEYRYRNDKGLGE
jgi:hypothetical protein